MELVELSQHQCFICRDSGNIMYKICECNDSIICDECYELESCQQMTQCGICRKKYVFEVERNYWDMLNILFKHITKYGVILCIELFCPIFLYIQADYSELNNVFLIYTFFCITIGNILTWYLTEKLIHNEESSQTFMLIYTPLKCIYIMLIFIIIQYINDIHKLKLYAYYILLFIYTIPLLFFASIILCRKGIKYKKYIDDNSILKKISIKAILTKSHSEV